MPEASGVSGLSPAKGAVFEGNRIKHNIVDAFGLSDGLFLLGLQAVERPCAIIFQHHAKATAQDF